MKECAPANYLPIAVRAYTESSRRRSRARRWSISPQERWPGHVLIFDTETTIDTTQRLLIGCYRLCRWKGKQLECLEEGLFYADDLPQRDPAGFKVLQEYAESRQADVAEEVPRRLELLSRTQFGDNVFWKIAYKARALVVAFNLPFDLSRIAIDAAPARGAFRGGFSFELWRWKSRSKRGLPQRFRPRITIRHLDSRRAFIRFTRPDKVDRNDQRPADGAPPDPRYAFPGRWLDLRAFVFALTGESESLASAGEKFGIAHPKAVAPAHGVVTAEYIDYCRRDVQASADLLERLREEFDRHPIELDPCAAYSPASIVKAYFEAMGLEYPARQFLKLPRELLGYAMSAFFGGRAEARIRKTAVPVVYTDFTSMYPTVQCLMDVWDLVSAGSIEAVDATQDVEKLLAEVSLNTCFDPEWWKNLRGFALVLPDRDVLPARVRFESSEWTVGVNPLTSETPLWYALPDLVASVLLTGKAPKVLEAFRLVSEGRQQRLRPVWLRGEFPVDPRRENLFRHAIESRQRIRADRSLSAIDRERMQGFLKVFANSGSYGVLVEMNRKETRKDQPVDVAVYGRNGRFSCRTTAPEDPGAFSFPPIAALITAGARLMLAILERCVSDAGGTYAFADTDSMAIVATREGGLHPCPGGARSLEGTSAIQVLAWSQVDAIIERFQALNPYDRDAVPDSILRIEPVNLDEARRRRQLWAYAISAKRYALFTIDAEGNSKIRRHSEHGLGIFMNPIDPQIRDRDWIRTTWEGIVREALGGSRFEPPWADVPAMIQSTVTTPAILRRFRGLDRAKPYSDRVKPFNFMLTTTVDPLERPTGLEKSASFQLIAPYSRKPSDWLRSVWMDLHSGKEFRIRSRGHTLGSQVRVRNYAEILERFRNHSEAKSGDSDGNPSDRWTIGLLQRRQVYALPALHIGKESNLIEQSMEGTALEDPQAIYIGEGDRDCLAGWIARVPIPRLARESGVSERMLRAIRSGDRNPSAKAIRMIVEAVGRLLEGGRKQEK